MYFDNQFFHPSEKMGIALMAITIGPNVYNIRFNVAPNIRVMKDAQNNKVESIVETN